MATGGRTLNSGERPMDTGVGEEKRRRVAFPEEMMMEPDDWLNEIPAIKTSEVCLPCSDCSLTLPSRASSRIID